jgi:hypothetical protein
VVYTTHPNDLNQTVSFRLSECKTSSFTEHCASDHRTSSHDGCRENEICPLWGIKLKLDLVNARISQVNSPEAQRFARRFNQQI